MNPLKQFIEWYDREVEKSSVRIPSACCLTSIGLDGYPNSRFVSLKEILNNKFVITGPLNSRKGTELLSNSKVALTFWWTATERQVRVQGDAIQIENTLADKYFEERSKESQIVSQICEQGVPIEDPAKLVALLETQKAEINKNEIHRPKTWSGFYIIPKRIEFMKFEKSRFHYRELFINEEGIWKKTILQP